MTQKILEVLISDILVAALISGIFTFISNKHADKNEKNEEKQLQLIKEHIDLKFELLEAKLKNDIQDV